MRRGKHQDALKPDWARRFACLALICSFALCAWDYLRFRQAFFDDAFIYLHLARNGADEGTWQFFTLAERPALLASSPLKIVLLTLAGQAGGILGFGDRTFANAKVTLLLYAPLGWALWYPFWRDRKTAFVWLGAAYFTCSLALEAAFDFEGGLLFCWVATLTLLLGDSGSSARTLMAWAVPLGLFIRVDLALPIAAVVAVFLGGAAQVALAAFNRLTFLSGIWWAVCWLMHVWPIPVTYWAKAAMPLVFEEQYMLQVVFERIGWVAGFRLIESAAAATLLGVLIVAGFGVAMIRDGRGRLAALVAVVVHGVVAARLPANFWWYYQNLVMVFLGVALGVLARCTWRRLLPEPERRPVAVFFTTLLAVVLAGKSFTVGPLLWRVDAPSRAEGYMYLARNAVGDGTYTLAGVGTVFIKNPEIGMISYFSGSRAWIWDAAGLAQPLSQPQVTESVISRLYPRRLREPAQQEARRLADRTARPLRVIEAWAMEDRNFAAARRKCTYVIEEGAICANDYLVPSK